MSENNEVEQQRSNYNWEVIRKERNLSRLESSQNKIIPNQKVFI